MDEYKPEVYQRYYSIRLRHSARNKRQGGAITFVDDYTAWERRSGATFEADKIAIIHFTPKIRKFDHSPFTIKGQTVILGILMDTRLKYKEHITRVASKGLKVVIKLRQLQGLTPATKPILYASVPIKLESLDDITTYHFIK
ncbi:Transposon I factor [Penicillium malachiteum]|uniref:Transposon I factor n=1 Tax=Penicillium malachiteum TaxID=1324776 RepID=A0AAD6HXE0_9EURO|nr:Transposon I factor [Penicillium malachiteum]